MLLGPLQKLVVGQIPELDTSFMISGLDLMQNKIKGLGGTKRSQDLRIYLMLVSMLAQFQR